MAHTPFHLTFADVRPEVATLTGVDVRRAASAADLERVQRRGGLLGRALEISEQGRTQQFAQQQAGQERFTRATERQEEIGTERREFRREQFERDIALARRGQAQTQQINVDAISRFIKAAQEATDQQSISDVATVGLSAIFLGVGKSLGLTTKESLGIAAKFGATIGGVPPSEALQGALGFGGRLVDKSLAEDRQRELQRIADINEAFTQFGLSDDPREGFVPVIGEQFRSR